MKKIVFVSTFSDFFWTFEKSNLNIVKSKGYKIYIVANFSEKSRNEHKDYFLNMGATLIDVPFERNPFRKETVICYKEIKRIIREINPNIIDCHLAVPGVLCRMAVWRKKDIKVIYSPHGFFFYKGCPLFNILIYRSVERIMARRTDALITINSEDYRNAKKMKLRGKSYFLPGVGVDINSIETVIPAVDIRTELNIQEDMFLFLSIGELNKNKNHETVIRAMGDLKKRGIVNFHYLICGRDGPEKEKIILLSKQYGIDRRVHYLGFRTDIANIAKQVNVFVLPSFKEGLSVSIIEAMACGLPILASNIRGNNDLVVTNKGGFLFNPQKPIELAEHMKFLLENEEFRDKAYSFNLAEVQKYSNLNVISKMQKIYSEMEK